MTPDLVVNPTFTKIMAYVKKEPSELYTIMGNCCSPHAILGKCWAGARCKRDHSPASDHEADQILDLLKPFTTKPKGLLDGQ